MKKYKRKKRHSTILSNSLKKITKYFTEYPCCPKIKDSTEVSLQIDHGSQKCPQNTKTLKPLKLVA